MRLRERRLASGVLRRPALAVAAALGAGVALGISGRVSDYLGPELRLLFALGAPWFLVAFAVGTATRRPATGAACGALAQAVSVAVYYAVMLTVERRTGHGYAVSMTVLWGAAAVLCGAVFGAAGAAAAGGEGGLRGAALALLGGTLAGEAVLFIALGGAGAGSSVLLCELAVGAGLVLTSSRPPRPYLVALGATAAVAAAAADGVLRAVMRARGWGG